MTQYVFVCVSFVSLYGFVVVCAYVCFVSGCLPVRDNVCLNRVLCMCVYVVVCVCVTVCVCVLVIRVLSCDSENEMKYVCVFQSVFI